MKRQLPPLNPLRTFDAAARHGNFTAAAAELHVTQAAISRQVATLESYLGVKLFVRKNRNIRLTDHGRKYAASIGKALSIIDDAGLIFPSRKARVNTLHIQAYNTLAQYWLIPRLQRFVNERPQLDIQLRTSVEQVDFERGDIHVWLNFGKVNRADLIVVPFLQDAIQPACSVELAASYAGLEMNEILASATVLHASHRRGDWGAWLRHIGLANFRPKRSITFESSALAYEAAAEGLGIALVQLPMVQTHLASGKLALLTDTPLIRPLYHQVVYHPSAADSPTLQAFVEWVNAEAQADGVFVPELAAD